MNTQLFGHRVVGWVSFVVRPKHYRFIFPMNMLRIEKAFVDSTQGGCKMMVIYKPLLKGQRQRPHFRQWHKNSHYIYGEPIIIEAPNEQLAMKLVTHDGTTTLAILRKTTNVKHSVPQSMLTN